MNSDYKDPNPEFKMLRHDYLKVFAIGVAYFIAHKIAFFFPDQEKVIMLIWPAGGVGLAAFMMLFDRAYAGRRYKVQYNLPRNFKKHMSLYNAVHYSGVDQ
jgi:hypothetical protein